MDRTHADAQESLWTRSFALITVENFLVAITFWLLMTVVSKFATDRFGASDALAGFCTSIFIVGAIIGRPLCGKWIHRVGQTRTLAVGVVAHPAAHPGLLRGPQHRPSAAHPLRPRGRLGRHPRGDGHDRGERRAQKRYGEGLGYFTMSQLVATGIGPFIGLLLIQRGSFDSVIIACAVASGASACSSSRSCPSRTWS